MTRIALQNAGRTLLRWTLIAAALLGYLALASLIDSHAVPAVHPVMLEDGHD
ncbi:hypothetical protein ACTSKR_07550 [Chitinibacteraceae bacterium HSL-7]